MNSFLISLLPYFITRYYKYSSFTKYDQKAKRKVGIEKCEEWENRLDSPQKNKNKDDIKKNKKRKKKSTPPLLWRRGLTIANITFTHSPLCVQVWSLPFKNKTDETRKDIGSRLVRVIEVDKQSWEVDQAKFMRVRVGRLMNH